MQEDIYMTINKKIEQISKTLAVTDNKNVWQTGFAPGNFQFAQIKGRIFVLVQSNLFRKLISDKVYLDVAKAYPKILKQAMLTIS